MASASKLPGLDHDSLDVDEEPLWSNAPPEETEGEGTDTEALYATLNLAKDCSQEDIGKSYKRLAGELHRNLARQALGALLTPYRAPFSPAAPRSTL